jgi:hypothetical protein
MIFSPAVRATNFAILREEYRDVSSPTEFLERFTKGGSAGDSLYDPVVNRTLDRLSRYYRRVYFHYILGMISIPDPDAMLKDLGSLEWINNEARRSVPASVTMSEALRKILILNKEALPLRMTRSQYVAVEEFLVLHDSLIDHPDSQKLLQDSAGAHRIDLNEETARGLARYTTFIVEYNAMLPVLGDYTLLQSLTFQLHREDFPIQKDAVEYLLRFGLKQDLIDTDTSRFAKNVYANTGESVVTSETETKQWCYVSLREVEKVEEAFRNIYSELREIHFIRFFETGNRSPLSYEDYNTYMLRLSFQWKRDKPIVRSMSGRHLGLSGDGIQIAAVLGIADALIHEKNYAPDVITAVSTSSLLTLPLAMGKFHDLTSMVLHLDFDRYFGIRPAKAKPGRIMGAVRRTFLSDSEDVNHPLTRWLDSVVGHEDFREYQTNDKFPTIIIGVGASTEGILYFNLKKVSYNSFLKIILGACAIPIFHRGVRANIKGNNSVLYYYGQEQGGIASEELAAVCMPERITESISVFTRPHSQDELERRPLHRDSYMQSLDQYAVQRSNKFLQWNMAAMDEFCTRNNARNIKLYLPEMKKTSIFDCDPKNLYFQYNEGILEGGSNYENRMAGEFALV